MTQTTEQNSTASKGPLTTTPFVEVSKTINAPIEPVWQAWVDPTLIKQWWGPSEFSCPFAETDFRIEGKYLFAMKTPEGNEMWTTGEYLEIFPYELIVCTDQFSDEKGNPISAIEAGMGEEWQGIDKLIFSVKFSKISEDSTSMQLVHEGIPATEHDDCVDGWSTSFNKLKALVEKN